jgi:hypothetical protein
LEIAPGQPDVLASLASVYLAQDDHRAAIDAILRSLALSETPHARRVFVQCVRDLQFDEDPGLLSALLLRALREGWDRPDDLAPVAAAAILRTPGIAVLMARIQDRGLLDGDGLTALAQDQLLQALLICAPNLDIALERLLTLARRTLLDRAVAAAQDDRALEFHAALARQCFINEYVFSVGDGELAQAQQLRDALVVALENNEPVPSSWIATVASYFPLESVSLRLTGHGLGRSPPCWPSRFWNPRKNGGCRPRFPA